MFITPLNLQADRIQSQELTNLYIFLVVLQGKTTDPSKRTHLIPIQLCFIHLHWQSLAM